MKKSIIIIVLCVACAASLAFGVYQKQRADEAIDNAIRNEAMARASEQKAHHAMILAEEQRRIAEANAMEALRQSQLALETLKKQRR